MPLVDVPTEIPESSLPAPTPIAPRPGERPDGGYKGAVVDLRKTSIESLLVHVDGSRWSIKYYRQLLGEHSEPASFQKNQLPIYQQYEEIINYPLIVTSELSESQEPDTLKFIVTGSSIISHSIVPNIHDIFIADCGDGRDGLFSISDVVRKSILLDSCYEISYNLLFYMDRVSTESLKLKVVRTLYFSTEMLGSGRGALLISEEIEKYRRIFVYRDLLCEAYMNMFYDELSGTLLRPDKRRVYDDYLVEAYNAISDSNPVRHRISLTLSNKVSIWNWLIDGRRGKYIDPFQYVDLKNISTINSPLIYSGIAMSRISDIVVPAKYSVEPVVNNSEDVICPIVNSRYLFTTAFYTGDRDKMPLIERLCDEYLSTGVYEGTCIDDVYDDIDNWSELDRFYFIPVVILLMNWYLSK